MEISPGTPEREMNAAVSPSVSSQVVRRRAHDVFEISSKLLEVFSHYVCYHPELPLGEGDQRLHDWMFPLGHSVASGSLTYRRARSAATSSRVAGATSAAKSSIDGASSVPRMNPVTPYVRVIPANSSAHCCGGPLSRERPDRGN